MSLPGSRWSAGFTRRLSAWSAEEAVQGRKAHSGEGSFGDGRAVYLLGRAAAYNKEVDPGGRTWQQGGSRKQSYRLEGTIS
mgnify:CR=1 FL=1